MTKESVTVRGNTTYNGVGKANMTVMFTKDISIVNNTAITRSIKTDQNGSYIIELTPGSYNITVEETVIESGQNVTYTGADRILLTSGEAPRILNIVLTREQTP